MNEEIREATKVSSLEPDELQPTDEWREKLAGETTAGNTAQWFGHAMSPTFRMTALG